MARFAAQIGYDGTDFFGWQRQLEGRTVQQTIEVLLTKLNSQKPVTVVARGRTDSGVHAIGQVVHFDVANAIGGKELLHKIERMLPDDLAIHALQEVPQDFHARFDAKSREYRYDLLHHHDPFRIRYAWRVHDTLDVAAMESAAYQLRGRFDFTALSKNNPDTKNMVCDLSLLEIDSGSDFTSIRIKADRFLYGMVRMMTGFLVEIGRGRRDEVELLKLLHSRRREGQATLAPAKGLTFVHAEYPTVLFDGGAEFLRCV